MEVLTSRTRKIKMNIEAAALADAAEVLGTVTDQETVNAALRHAAQRMRRREAFDRLAQMAEAGYFDELLEKRNYRR